MPADTLRPVIAEILRVRSFQIPRSLTIPGSFEQSAALAYGSELLEYVDAREADELDDYREERIAELRSEVSERELRIEVLERNLAAATKRGTRAAAELAKLKLVKVAVTS